MSETPQTVLRARRWATSSRSAWGSSSGSGRLKLQWAQPRLHANVTVHDAKMGLFARSPGTWILATLRANGTTAAPRSRSDTPDVVG